MSTRDSSLGECEMEGCIGGNGFVVSEVPLWLVKTSAIGDTTWGAGAKSWGKGGTGGTKAPMNEGVL